MRRCFMAILLVSFTFTPVVISDVRRQCYTGTCLNTGDGSQKSWQDAKTYCESQNGTLVNVVSADIENKLRQFINDSNMFKDNLWIGVSAVSSDSQFRWINGQSISDDVVISNQGNASSRRRFASVAGSSGTLSYSANTYEKTFFFICETSSQSRCDSGSKSFMGRWYCKYESTTKTWFEASNYCLSQGGILATFDGTTTANVGNFLVSTLGLSSGASYWIGLILRWWINSCGQDALYTDWQQNNLPSTTVEASPCVVIDSFHTPYGWQSNADHPCSKQLRFICQETSCTSTTSTTSSTTSTTTTTTTTTTITKSSHNAPFTMTSSTTTVPLSSTTTGPDNKSLGAGIGIGLAISVAIALIAAAIPCLQA